MRNSLYGSGIKRPSAKCGAALGLVLIVLVVVSLLGAGLVNLGGVDAVEAARAVSSAQAFWAAEAGVEYIMAWTYKNRVPFGTPTLPFFGPGAVLGATGQGTYVVDIQNDGPNSGAIKRYVITATGTSLGGDVRIVQIHARTDTFSSYMHASHREETQSGANIYFATGDRLDGQVYVNDQLNIWGSPEFLALVSSGWSSVNYQNGGDASVFQAGLVLNATPLDFNQFSDHVDNIETVAQSGGLVLAGDQQITFYSDGTFTAKPESGEGTVTNSLSNPTFNGAIYVDGDVNLQGTVNGNVTVASENRIEIAESGVVYESTAATGPFDPSFDPDNVDDSLGLVARSEVRVLGGSDIPIHAAILVTDDGNGFNTARKYDWLGRPHINLYGSISQYRRGVVGRVNGQGFLKNYKYDTRFISSPPPYFPYSKYNYTNWRESTT